MYIDIGCVNGSMPKSFGNGFDITSIGCGRVSQPMKLQMTETVFFQKLIKLFGRRMRMHDVTAPVGKEEALLMPFLTEEGFFTVLLLFQFLQDVAESLWNCHLTNAAVGFWGA